MRARARGNENKTKPTYTPLPLSFYFRSVPGKLCVVHRTGNLIKRVTHSDAVPLIMILDVPVSYDGYCPSPSTPVRWVRATVSRSLG